MPVALEYCTRILWRCALICGRSDDRKSRWRYLPCRAIRDLGKDCFPRVGSPPVSANSYIRRRPHCQRMATWKLCARADNDIGSSVSAGGMRSVETEGLWARGSVSAIRGYRPTCNCTANPRIKVPSSRSKRYPAGSRNNTEHLPAHQLIAGRDHALRMG